MNGNAVAINEGSVGSNEWAGNGNHVGTVPVVVSAEHVRSVVSAVSAADAAVHDSALCVQHAVPRNRDMVSGG